MRALQLGFVCGGLALAISGCLGHDGPCSADPMDPLCHDPDGGPRPDSGADTGGGDAHVGCGGTCMGTTPHCLVSGTSETCVACIAEGDCTGGLHCNMTNHTCVECTTMAQCTDVGMSRCDTRAHTCGACAADGDCTHLTTTPRCDTAAGMCVACTSNTDCDATHGCELGTHTCVAFTAMSATTCGACVRDAECHAGQLCVPMTYDDPSTPAADPVDVGNHCLWRQDATGAGAPAGSCLNVRPYTRATSISSVDGVSAMVCNFRESTCAAQAAFTTTNCMTLDAAGDALCGVTGVHDGMCQAVDATHNRCTVFCLGDDDCPGTTCAPGAVPRACTF